MPIGLAVVLGLKITDLFGVVSPDALCTDPAWVVPPAEAELLTHTTELPSIELSATIGEHNATVVYRCVADRPLLVVRIPTSTKAEAMDLFAKIRNELLAVKGPPTDDSDALPWCESTYYLARWHLGLDDRAVYPLVIWRSPAGSAHLEILRPGELGDDQGWRVAYFGPF
jgi:hypothetical protein